MYAEWLPDFKHCITVDAGEGIILFVVAVQVNVKWFLAAEFGRTAQITAGQSVALLNRLYQMEQQIFIKTLITAQRNKSNTAKTRKKAPNTNGVVQTHWLCLH